MSLPSVITSVAINPDGDTIAVGDSNGVLGLQPMPDGERKSVKLHEGIVRCCAFSPDGAKVVTGGDDKKVFVLDVTTGTGRVYTEHNGAISAVSMSDTGVIASASSDHTVRLWNAHDSGTVHVLRHDMPVQTVVFDPTGRFVASAVRRTVGIWDVNDGRLIHTFGVGYIVRVMRFARNGSMLATAGDSHLVTVWNSKKLMDVATPPVIKQFAHKTGNKITALAFRPDGVRLASGDNAGYANQWTIADGSCESSRLQNRVIGVEFDYDQNILVIAR